MNLPEFIEALQQLQRQHPGKTLEVVVPVHGPGKVGSSACVLVKSAYKGFDWDDSKVFLEVSKPVTTLTPEEVADITKSVSTGASWHAFQSYKAQQAKIDALTAELALFKK